MAEQVLWTSPGGAVIDLTDEGAGFRLLAAGTRGLTSPPYEVTSSRLAGVDGVRVDAVRAAAREPVLGLMVRAEGEDAFRARVRGLVRAMRPKAGPGTLTVVATGGEVRRLGCYCVEGLEGDESPDVTLPGYWWKAALRFLAPDPWWYGPEQTVDFGLAAPSTFFPMFPLVLSPSAIQGSFTVDLSAADTESFPVWTVTGPGSALTLTNTSTGRSLAVTANLGDGQSMTIDTRPGRQSVRRNDGTNLMGSLGTDPALWSLTDGPNAITALLTNAGAASRIRGVYTPRYAGI